LTVEQLPARGATGASMSVESFEQTPVGKFDSAMSALIGHLLAEFL
jgi:hypothetical protein